MPTKELHFSIEGTTPHTLPMARLAEYLKELSRLLGSEKRVHFLRVDEGSANCAMEVDADEEGVITERVVLAKQGGGSKEAVHACRRLQSLLDEDDNSAVMEWQKGAVIIEFPGKSREKEESYGPFTVEGSLMGILVNLGGVDETVPVHLVYQGRRYNCNATRDMARRLRNYLLEKPIRVFGRGKWYRNAQGQWEMHWFDISDFEEVDDATLWDAVGQLRAIPDNDLAKSDDPLGDMLKLRHG